MRQFEIQVNSVKDVLDFVSIATKRSFPIMVGNEKHRVNGKSFMDIIEAEKPQIYWRISRFKAKI